MSTDFRPVTSIATDFELRYQHLSFVVQAYRSKTAQEVSDEVYKFFEYARSLPERIMATEHSLTILFEIDQSLLGSYGSLLFTRTTTDPFHNLLRDMVALYYRYSMLGEIERIKPSIQKISSIRSFYTDWRSSENIGAEGNRIIENLVSLLEVGDVLDNRSKILMFSLLGDVLITLGWTEDIVVDRLYDYLDDVRARKISIPKKSLAEICIYLYIIYRRTGTLRAEGITPSIIYKFVRFWVANDVFFEQLFRSWGVFWEHDYYSPLDKGDQVFRDSSTLLYKLLNKTFRLGVGRQFQDRDFSIPVFIFGQKNVGKSSFLTSFAYDVQMRPGMKPTTLGRELQAHYEQSYRQWTEGEQTPTTETREFSIWRNLEISRYDTIDYNGSEIEPERWNRSLQDKFVQAKALMFLIDDSIYMDERKLRECAAWFDTALQYWMKENPGRVHIPISLVLTKSDRALGDEFASLRSPLVVPQQIVPASIEYFFPHRFSGNLTPDLNTRAGRLRDCLLQRKENNQTPGVQDIIQNVVDSMTVFINRVLDVTYNYQFFITSASAPLDGGRRVDKSQRPFGVQEPFLWMMDALEQLHYYESIENFSNEEKNAVSLLDGLRTGIKRVHELVALIGEVEKELHRLRHNPTFTEKLMSDDRNNKIRMQEDNKRIADEEIERIYMLYFKDKPESNRTLQIQALDAEERRQDSTLRAIRSKRQDYEGLVRDYSK